MKQACEMLKLLAKHGALTITTLTYIPENRLHPGLIARMPNKKAKQESGMNFYIMAFCPCCGVPTAQGGEPQCVDAPDDTALLTPTEDAGATDGAAAKGAL